MTREKTDKNWNDLEVKWLHALTKDSQQTERTFSEVALEKKEGGAAEDSIEYQSGWL